DRVVERHDPRPIRISRSRRSRMARSDPSLERVWTQGAPMPLGTLESRQAAPDEQSIPAGSILIEQEDGLAGRSDASAQPRGLDLHERDETVDFRFSRGELRQDAAETKRLLAQLGSDP